MDIYSLEKLEELYKNLLEKNAKIYMMKDIKQLDKGIILRHDLDSEIDSALTVAQLEHQMGIKSTYYFLLTSYCYNLYSARSQKIVAGIIELGHEVGLHFDTSIYPERKIQKEFQKEKHILESIIEQEVYSVSLHNPSNNNNYPFFDNVINAYNWDLFSSNNYFSDSVFEFNSTVKEIVDESNHNIVQLLLHPTLYCIRNKSEDPGIIYISKVEIERFADRLMGPIIKHPRFKDEIEKYPQSSFNVNVKLKD